MLPTIEITPDIMLEVLAALREPVAFNGSGICKHVRHGVNPSRKFVAGCLLERMFSAWPEFSGNIDYPVPHPRGPITAYNLTKNLWVGRYGAGRKRLLAFCIAYLEERLT